MTAPAFLRDPLLEAAGVPHGFGVRGAVPPDGVLRPRQVHGISVANVDAAGLVVPEEADAVMCGSPGLPVGVVTADCVPILVAASSGRVVAAVHAGWRGLAAGVVSQALKRISATTPEPLTAALGPHAKSCCYEVDAPVLGPLDSRFGAAELDASLRASRPGHHWLDLERLVVLDLVRSGVPAERIGHLAAHCTVCDAARFESHRRDGPTAGRLLHWVQARGPA